MTQDQRDAGTKRCRVPATYGTRVLSDTWASEQSSGTRGDFFALESKGTAVRPGRDQPLHPFEAGLGGDESKRRGAESQWIVAARPLCHLQYPVAYLSRLQRILPDARRESHFKAARTARPPRGLHQRHVPLGADAPTAGRQTSDGRAHRF